MCDPQDQRAAHPTFHVACGPGKTPSLEERKTHLPLFIPRHFQGGVSPAQSQPGPSYLRIRAQIKRKAGFLLGEGTHRCAYQAQAGPSLNTGQKTSPGVWLARAFTLPRADILRDAAACQLMLPPASVLDPFPPPSDAPPPGHIKGGLTQEASPNGAA